jgi:hypothetical protein
VLGGAVLPPRSVDTTLTFALTHEIWSYGEQRKSLRAFVQAIYDHTAPGGVWINSDVCGPDGRDRQVLLRLERGDGANPDRPRLDLAQLQTAEVTEYVSGLSTRARFEQFAVDYRFPFDHGVVGEAFRLKLGDAMDFLTRKDYTANWMSETQEQFCGLEFSDWTELLAEVGFDIDAVSGTSRNEWIIGNRLAPVASLTDLDGEALQWPVTHVLLVARRPLNT